MNTRSATAHAEWVPLPSFEELRAISAREGVDTATTLLYKSVLESPQHRWFIERIQSLTRETAPQLPPHDAKLVIVPGGFYRENPRSGADGHVVREQAERIGWPVELIPVASTGSIIENARTICRWLSEHRDARIVLVSLSKGGSDLKLALEQPGAKHAFERVVFWINLCGILEGTPLASWLLSRRVDATLYRLYFRFRGLSLDFIRDLRRGPGCALDFKISLPTHLQMINVVGFPLRQHLTSGMSRRCHHLLAPDGPNDGGMLLADVCAQPGLIYPVWSADHYLRSGVNIEQLIVAILRFVGQELTTCQPAHSSTLASR